MNTDRNLLFGVLALQADLIDPSQFVEACTLWTSRKDVPLAEVLIERGWILPVDRAHIDYLLERKLKKHGGDSRATLASISDDVKRSLAALDDVERPAFPDRPASEQQGRSGRDDRSCTRGPGTLHPGSPARHRRHRPRLGRPRQPARTRRRAKGVAT